jgi:hypothetical protein
MSRGLRILKRQPGSPSPDYRVVDIERQKTAFVVMGIEQAELPMPSRPRTWDPDAHEIADRAILLDEMVGAPIPRHQAEDAVSLCPQFQACCRIALK